VAEAWIRELLSGYLRQEPYLLPLEEKPPDALVVVRGIRFVSVCRHHLLPFQGRAAVGYQPGKSLAGFSGIARLVETLSRRLMIQEELSQQILDHLDSALAPRGAACLIEATHQCMTCRGARQAESIVTTVQVRGIFSRNARRRREVIDLLRGVKQAGKERR
jgi:GTP cyclohydrolase I